MRLILIYLAKALANHMSDAQESMCSQGLLLEHGPVRLILKLAGSNDLNMLSGQIECRGRLAFGRLAGLIRRIGISIIPTKDSIGNRIWRCRVTAVQSNAPTVIIEITDIELAAAANRAIDRAARRVYEAHREVVRAGQFRQNK